MYRSPWSLSLSLTRLLSPDRKWWRRGQARTLPPTLDNSGPDRPHSIPSLGNNNLSEHVRDFEAVLQIRDIFVRILMILLYIGTVLLM